MQEQLPPSQRMQRLYLRTYRLRTLGMGLGILPAALVLHELHASWPSWAWIAVCGLLWPHLAFLKSHHSPDPSTSELHNFVIDSALAATLLPIMHFNLLPSALLLTVTTADKLNTGIRGLWWRSLLGALAALVIAIGISGLHFDIHTSTPVLLACLPLTMIHTLVVSASSYQLIRKVQKNNQALDELRRRDSLTGLQSRSHWQEMADQQLQRHVAGHASTLVIDRCGQLQAHQRHLWSYWWRRSPAWHRTGHTGYSAARQPCRATGGRRVRSDPAAARQRSPGYCRTHPRRHCGTAFSC